MQKCMIIIKILKLWQIGHKQGGPIGSRLSRQRLVIQIPARDENLPVSKASRKLTNLTERKIHIPPYMVTNNLSVCLLPNLTPIISKLAKENGLKFFLDIYGKKVCLKKNSIKGVQDLEGLVQLCNSPLLNFAY